MSFGKNIRTDRPQTFDEMVHNAKRMIALAEKAKSGDAAFFKQSPKLTPVRRLDEVLAALQRYVPQPVQVQPLDAHTVLVTQGLAADNRVVVRGAALVAQIR